MFSIPIILIILTLATGGVVVGVSDGAAPGDLLYNVDRGVEELRLQLINDPFERMVFQEKIHAERLEEIQDLAARDEPEQLKLAIDNLEFTLEELAPTPLLTETQPDEDLPNDNEEDNLGFYCRNIFEEDTKRHPTGEKLAETFDVEYAEIMEWACNGFGFGGIVLAYQISSAAEVDVEEVFGLKSSGMGWGEIQMHYGLKGDQPTEEEPEDGEPEDGEPEDGEPGEEEPGEETEKETKTGAYCNGSDKGEHPTGAKLASRYGVAYADIMHWFCQRYGFGEIDLAYTIRDFAQVSVDEVFALRASGWGWGKIMDFYGMRGKNGQPPGQVDKDKDKDKVKPTKKPKKK